MGEWRKTPGAGDRAPRQRQRRREPEHVEQKAFFRWAALHERQYVELDMLAAVPNGRYRTVAEAGKLKAEGQKRGYPDVLLDVPRGKYHGLRIEMKAPGNATTPEQRDWAHRLVEFGYYYAVCYSWQAAVRTVLKYLGYPEPEYLMLAAPDTATDDQREYRTWLQLLEQSPL